MVRSASASAQRAEHPAQTIFLLPGIVLNDRPATLQFDELQPSPLHLRPDAADGKPGSDRRGVELVSSPSKSRLRRSWPSSSAAGDARACGRRAPATTVPGCTSNRDALRACWRRRLSRWRGRRCRADISLSPRIPLIFQQPQRDRPAMAPRACWYDKPPWRYDASRLPVSCLAVEIMLQRQSAPSSLDRPSSTVARCRCAGRGARRKTVLRLGLFQGRNLKSRDAAGGARHEGRRRRSRLRELPGIGDLPAASPRSPSIAPRRGMSNASLRGSAPPTPTRAKRRT